MKIAISVFLFVIAIIALGLEYVNLGMIIIAALLVFMLRFNNTEYPCDFRSLIKFYKNF